MISGWDFMHGMPGMMVHFLISWRNLWEGCNMMQWIRMGIYDWDLYFFGINSTYWVDGHDWTCFLFSIDI